MKAIGVLQWGGPKVLQVVDVPEPHAGPDEVRIRVHAAGVNPTDALFRNGAQEKGLTQQAPPYIPGMDAAGIVDEVGAGADRRFQVGDRVVCVVAPARPGKGAYQSLLVVNAASVVQAPAKLDLFAASAFLMNALTVRLALEAMALKPGQTLVLTGGAGAVGQAAMQLGKAQGLRVISDVSKSSADRALLESLGADVLVPRGERFVQELRRLAPGGVAAIIDSALLNGAVAPAIADGGWLVTLRRWNETLERGVRVFPVYVAEGLQRTELLEQLRDQVDAGVLTPRVARVFPAAQAAEAHRFLEAGGVRGRPVLDFTGLS